MQTSLLAHLVDPVSRSPLEISEQRGDGHQVREGVLRGLGVRRYVITNGIPRFVLTDDHGQRHEPILEGPAPRGCVLAWWRRKSL